MSDEARLTAIHGFLLKNPDGTYSSRTVYEAGQVDAFIADLLASHARAVEARQFGSKETATRKDAEQSLTGVSRPPLPSTQFDNVVAAQPHEQEQAYPWDKVRAECWNQVETVFREQGRDGAMACFYRSAPVDNARKLDEEQIDSLRAALTAKDQQLGQALRNQNLNAAAAVIRDGELREAEAALTALRAQPQLPDDWEEFITAVFHEGFGAGMGTEFVDSRDAFNESHAKLQIESLRARLAVPPQAQEP